MKILIVLFLCTFILKTTYSLSYLDPKSRFSTLWDQWNVCWYYHTRVVWNSPTAVTWEPRRQPTFNLHTYSSPQVVTWIVNYNIAPTIFTTVLHGGPHKEESVMIPYFKVVESSWVPKGTQGNSTIII
jgi:hypothetical protein